MTQDSQLELTQDQLDEVVPAGLEFLRILTETLGLDAGVKFHNQLLEAVPAEVRGQILFAQLTGNYTGAIMTMTWADRETTHSNKIRVPAIKCVRTYTGLGLKEALDVVDTAIQGQTMRISLSRSETESITVLRKKFKLEMTQMGFAVK
jgi:hypothetical protein